MITIDRLTRRRGPRTVLDQVTFAAAPGRVTALLGPNGAGKSTALRILLGLDRPTTGTAHIGGRPYRSLPAPLHVVGAAFDGPGAHPSRTARGHLGWLARSNHLPSARVPEVLDLVGLAHAAGSRVGTFSLGMMQRLALAAALLGDPPVLVLDEPATGLDPEGIRWLHHLLRARADAGCTVLLSSHLVPEVAAVADDVVLLATGRVVAAGTVDDVTHGADLAETFFLLTGPRPAPGALTDPEHTR